MVECSGFEDVVFQAGICTSGSLNGVMTGSHYNKAWAIHSCMSEGLETLLLKRLLAEIQPYNPDALKEASCDDADLINEVVINSEMDISSEYQRFTENVQHVKILFLQITESYDVLN